MIDDLEEIEPNLLGDVSKEDICAKELDVAGTIANLSCRMLDIVSNIYQLHGNVVRLGNNIEILSKSIHQYTMDFDSKIRDLRMRLEDLEVLQVVDSENQKENNHGRK
jgi:hypothetical protein